VLQLSDPHLLADPAGRYRERRPLPLLRRALQECLGRMETDGLAPPDLLLLSGDLCQDESWGGYARLRDLLGEWDLPVALLPGNHDQPALLRAALGRQAVIAPARLRLGGWDLLLLDSHRPGCTGGRLGAAALDQVAVWTGEAVEGKRTGLLVAVHHPPVAIGDPEMDRIGLEDGPQLLERLADAPRLGAVVFGHIHQHWQGPVPGRPEVPLLGCPSTLCSFAAVQPCPLGRPEDPGGRLIELLAGGGIRQRLLRWSAADPPTVN
jgi:Icc protein